MAPDSPNQKDYELAINYRSLVSSLDTATKTLKVGSTDLNDLSFKLESLSKDIDTIQPMSRYKDLTDDQKKAIDDIQPILKDAIKIARKQLSSKKSSKDDKKYAQEVVGSIRGVASRWVAYLHSSKSSKAYTTPALGTKEDNDIVKAEAQQITNSAVEASKFIAAQQNILATYSAPKPAPPVTIDDSFKGDDSSSKMSKFPIDAFNRALSGISVGMSTFANAVGEFAKGMAEAYATMMEGFGDIMDNPLESAISIMRGMTSMLNSCLSMLSGIIDSVTSFLSTALSGAPGSKSSKSRVGSKMTIVATIVNTILSVVSSVISVAMQAIQAGFNIFASTLTATFKLVKKIATSSPIITAIMNLLNLAFTMFFMPFMNSFALVLLPYVADLLTWAANTGQKFSELGAMVGQQFVDMLFNDQNLLDRVEAIATSFITEFLPEFLTKVLPKLLDFALDFTETILENKDLILSFLDEGLKAFTAMIENNILSDFLNFGKDVMVWLSMNAKTIVSFSSSVLRGLLQIAKLFMGIVGGGDSDNVSNAIKDVEIIERSLDESGIYTDLENMGGTISNTEFNFPEFPDNSPITDVQTNSKGELGALGGGIPDISRNTPTSSLTDKDIKDIERTPTIVVNNYGTYTSSEELGDSIKKEANKSSNRSYYT